MKNHTSVMFTHSGVSGRAAREGLRQTVIATLSKAGLLPKRVKS